MMPNPMSLPDGISPSELPDTTPQTGSDDRGRMQKGAPPKGPQVLNPADFLNMDENGRFTDAYEIDASE